MEAAQKIARDVRGLFTKAVDAQCDQPLNVAAAFETANTDTEKIVRGVMEKMLADMTTNLEAQKNKACGGLQEHLDYSQEKCEYLYTCKSGISATLYIDVSLIL